MAIVLAPIASAPASAQTAPEEFTLTMPVGEGQILIRGAEEPAPLESPTAISGTNTGGAISDGTFTSPPISFERTVTSGGITTDVEITATFSEVTPGEVSGSINDQGDITLDLDLRVDLEVFVAIANDTFECTASPVAIELQSVEPYDEANGGSVVLSDPNFSVPTVPITDDCIELVANGVNAELAGPGHSLTLPLTGIITAPDFPGEPTQTTLAVSPGESTQGDDVTLTATVADVPDVAGTPSGTVDFRNGGTVIGSADVSASGVAVFTTDELLPGLRKLTATYRGVPETWAPSTSAIVNHRVFATPLLSADLPAAVEVGGDPALASVTVTNTGFGAPLSGLDLNVAIERPENEGESPIGPDGGTPRIVLNHVVGGVATEVPLTLGSTPAGEVLTGTILPAGSWELPAGAEQVEALTLQVSGATDPGPLQATFSLVRPPAGGGGEAEVVASALGQVSMVPADRIQSQVFAGDDFFFPAIVPAASRQGSVLDVNQVRVEPFVGGRSAGGTLQFLIDGVPAPSRISSAPSSVPFAASSPYQAGGITYAVQIPPTTPTGVRQVTIRYSGDRYFTPSQVQYPVRIEPSVGKTYECLWSGSAASYRTLVNVEAQASLPAIAPAGSDIAITDMDVELSVARSSSFLNVVAPFSDPEDYEQELSFLLGPDGAATATSVESTNSAPMEFDDGSDVDHTISFGGITGTVSIDGEPGEVVDVTLDTIEVDVIRGGGLEVGYDIDCLPVGDSVVLDRVTAAGTTLTASTTGPVAAGTPVTLTATAIPARPGTVEFRDGADTIGLASVNEAGVATVVADELAPGLRSIKAIYRGVPSGPVTTSEVIEVRIVGDCSTRTPVEPGNGAAVRLVYIELLRRCPDAGGYAYWKGQLDAGTATREVFAQRISDSTEARKIIVDDAYEMMLERAPEPGGRTFWATRLAGNGRYDDLVAELGASGEFRTLAGGTDEGVVERLYERIAQRSASASDVEFWVDFMERRGVRRTVKQFFNADEPLGRVVIASYQEILERDPSSTERADGVAAMKADSDRSALYASLIDLDEFFDRAQEFPELD